MSQPILRQKQRQSKIIFSGVLDKSRFDKLTRRQERDFFFHTVTYKFLFLTRRRTKEKIGGTFTGFICARRFGRYHVAKTG